MARNRLLGIWCFAGLLSLMACSDNALIDESTPLANQKWVYQDKPSFTVGITDVSRPYDLFINLRHTAAYKYSNLYLIVQQQYPNGRKTRIRLEIKLAEADGRWLGKGAGNLYAYQVRFARNYRFPLAGNYVFRLEQNMRENPLAEIQDAGIRIVPST